MKHIPTIQIIEELQKSGNQIGYRKRSDGGYIITSINGTKYSGSEGNNLARTMTGHALSDTMKAQRSSITSKRISYYNEMSKETQKQLRKTQKAWRENENKGVKSHRGKITAKQVKEALQKYGKKDVNKWLREAEKYSKGLAYEGAVDEIKERISREWSKYTDLLKPENQPKFKALSKADQRFALFMGNSVNAVTSFLESNKDNIKEVDQMHKLYSIMYDLSNNKMSEQQAINQIKGVLGIQ